MNSDCETQRKRSKNKQEEEEDEPGSSGTLMESLPLEIITNIFSSLPISSLVQSKCVCRAWRILLQDPNLVGTTHNKLCLIFHCDNPIRNHLYFLDFPSHSDEIDKVKKIQTPFCASMPEFDIIGSCNGLLCLSDSLYNDSVYIYNPFTRDYRELPKSIIQYPNQKVVFGFGFHSETKEYKVVKIIYYRNGRRRPFGRHEFYTASQSDVQVLALGSSTWRSLGKVSVCNDNYVDHWSDQVCANGRLVWRRRYFRGHSLVSFVLADEQFKEVPQPKVEGFWRPDYQLVVLRGCLAAAYHSRDGKLQIWVMKDYDVKDSWVKEFNIPSYMPEEPKLEMNRNVMVSKLARNGRLRVLCLLNHSEILLEYRSGLLVVYDPKSGKFKDLEFQGMPKWFQTVVHVGDLSQINTHIGT
ncbi:hypothetical protein FNV43_RR13000 [Rhamnella rubrinervis]|uniref:F-box domain-containing protein n=1 Tax=Rhamnella rubrinervis TaxID=2594499 RepID=A0A8K0MEP6_9ROSA|nr:hypothetical protein FNV43_RR13000 [Rhamnella rubrinervis]